MEKALTVLDIKTVVIQALNMLYKNDMILVADKRKSMERAIIARMGMYLRELCERDGIVVDCEYNRMGDGPKEMHGGKIIPDILIHQRNTDKQNLLYCEVKHKRGLNLKDKTKLDYATQPKGQWKYTVGAGIHHIKEDGVLVTWYTGAAFVDNVLDNKRLEEETYKYDSDTKQLIMV